jgi:hypothetical protein
MATSAIYLRLLACCAFALALVELALIVERAGAAFFKAYKFYFDGVSPIILSRDTVISFFFAAAAFFCICLLGIVVSTRRDPRAARLFRASAFLNITGITIIALLLMSPFVRT